MNDNSFERRLSELEGRIRLLEDRAAIFQLMATYGPAIDTCDSDSVAGLWAEDGIYDTDGYRFVGDKQVGSLAVLEEHKAVVRNGAAHVVGMPHLVIDGDHAVATGYSRVYLNKGDHHEVMRASSNRWEFLRTERGWRVTHRVNRRLTGTEESLALLSAGLHPAAK